MSVVTIAEYKSVIKFAARLKKDYDLSIPLYAWGMHATGKTSGVRQVADEMDYHCEVLNLANQNPEDLIGFPVKDENKGVMRHYPPDWLVKGREMGKPTIFFLDEVNRAPKYVKQGMFNFVNEGRLHNHHIGKDDIIVAAGNPDVAEYEVTDFRDGAWLSRFAHLEVEPSAEEVVNYISMKGGSSIIISMMKEDPELFAFHMPSEGRQKFKPDRRMGEKAAMLLKYVKPAEFAGVGIIMLEAMLGIEAAAIAFSKYQKMYEIPKPEEILDGSIAIEDIDTSKNDMIMVLNTAMMSHLESSGYLEKGTFPKKLKPILVKYVQHLLKDQAASFIRGFKDRGRSDKVVEIFDTIVPYLHQLLEVGKFMSVNDR